MTKRQVDNIIKQAVTDAETQQFPSEEITYTEMMENLEHARRTADEPFRGITVHGDGIDPKHLFAWFGRFGGKPHS